METPMAEDMIERAARKLAETDIWAGYDGEEMDSKAEWLNKAWPRYVPRTRDLLLAALDPEDGALLAVLIDAPTFQKLDVIDARIIIELIRTHAQGEPNGEKQTLEKDNG